MTDHRLERIDFKRPARFVAVCSCGWRSEPTINAGLAGALWDRHVERQAVSALVPQSLADLDRSVGDAARELYRDLVPALKHALRSGDPATASGEIDRMEALAAVLGDHERELARAVRQAWTTHLADPSTCRRSAVVVGLVELGDRAREHLAGNHALSRPQP